jgi:uncharacterized membrane protein (DUF485 family)
MVGMLQIVTYLLCVYLVFKGFEIFQIALMSSRDASRNTGIVIGVLAICVSVVAAIFFAVNIDQQAARVSGAMSRMP